jgi:hypothetical protein
MPTVTVYYDGWLKLPERIRRALGVTTDDLVELSLEKGVVTLKKAGMRREPDDTAEAAAEQPGEAPEAAEELAAAPEEEGRGGTSPAPRKARGRRKAKQEITE